MEQTAQYWMWDGTNNSSNKNQRLQIMTSLGSNNTSGHHHLYLQQQAPAALPPPPSCSSYEDSWEEQAFAEDAAGGALGGCIWPPRSYSCTFCRREFRSAQALGGHMNVHRRDRARLKQSPISPTTAPPVDPPMNHHQVPNSSVGYQFQLNPCRQIIPTNRNFTCISNNSPNPSPDPPPPPSSPPPRVSADSNSCSEKSFFPSAAEEEQINRKRPRGSMSDDSPPPRQNPVEEENYKRRNSRGEDLSAVSLNLVLQRSSSQLPTAASDGEVDVAAEEEARLKRRRIEDHTTSSLGLGLGLPFVLRGLSSAAPRRRSEVFEMMKSSSNSNPVGGASCLREELDLELRLGDRPPKVKTI